MANGKNWLDRKTNDEIFKIRNFRYPEDYSAVVRLWGQAGPGVQVSRSDSPPEIEKKLLRDPDLFLVAEKADQIIGTVIGGFDGRRGMVYHLAVSPEARQSGIGTALMTELEMRLKNKGCVRVYLMVTHANRQAIRFYKKRGWMRMENVLVYGKDIEQGEG